VGSAASPLERAIADIQGGGAALAFECGQSALDAILDLLLPGSRILVPHVWWNGAWTRGPRSLRVEPVGYASASRPDLEAAFRPGTSALILQSPSGPTLQPVDIAEIAEWSLRKGILLVVDTSLSIGERPGALDLGADIAFVPDVQHLAGQVPTRAAALVVHDPSLADRLRRIRERQESEPTSGDAWLAAQGVRTHAPRAALAAASADRIAAWLGTHSRVARVHRGIAAGTHLAVELRDEWIVPLLQRHLRSWKSAGTHDASSLDHPPTGSLRAIPSAVLKAAGLPGTLLRLRVGPEDPQLLIHDLEQAFSASTDALDYVI